jgi:hypothetical protein
MSGVCLECDSCGARYNGDDRQPNGFSWAHTYTLQKQAREIGWTGDMTRQSTNDKCPKCSNVVEGE